MQNATTEESQQ